MFSMNRGMFIPCEEPYSRNHGRVGDLNLRKQISSPLTRFCRNAPITCGCRSTLAFSPSFIKIAFSRFILFSSAGLYVRSPISHCWGPKPEFWAKHLFFHCLYEIIHNKMLPGQCSTESEDEFLTYVCL